MAKRRMFVSFVCGVDDELRDRAVAESRQPQAAFAVTASSSPVGAPDWPAKVRDAMQQCDVVAVICGTTTARDPGVNTEIKISREFALRHFLLQGRPEAKKPDAAHVMDDIQPWTTDALDRLATAYAKSPPKSPDTRDAAADPPTPVDE